MLIAKKTFKVNWTFKDMKISIISEKNNPLLLRKELKIDIEHDNSATPSKTELQQFLSKEFKKDVEQIDIRNIFSDSGISKSKAKVFLWEEKRVADLSKAVKEKVKEIKKEAKEEVKEVAKEEKPEKEVKEEVLKEGKEKKKAETKKETSEEEKKESSALVEKKAKEERGESNIKEKEETKGEKSSTSEEKKWV